jgi:5-methylcytosine-specific restriction endonuclease McrA
MKRINFSPQTKRKAYDRDKGICRTCKLPVKTGQEQYDHILPDALGGKSDLANCQLLCAPCHAEKTSKEDVPRIRKADRQRAKHVGARNEPTMQSRDFDKPAKQAKPSKYDWAPKFVSQLYVKDSK